MKLQVRWAAAALGTVLTAVPGALRAQLYTVTPTYQASIRQYPADAAGREYRSWGLMVGSGDGRTGWSPHLWVQRYEIRSPCPGARPGSDDCRTEGWVVSIGPAIDFVDSDRWTGSLRTQLGIASRGTRDVVGGGGLHVGVRWGLFRPQAFGRFQVGSEGSYFTVGVGVTFRITGEPPGDGVFH